jgi:cytochrome c oxidase assembly protein subunit 11
MTGPAKRRNIRTATLAAGVALGMAGLSYASVPLYALFCQVTGFGGTTQRAEAAPAEVLDRLVTVRFDSNAAGGLGWNFRPEQLEMTLRLGAEGLAHYRATNLSGRTVTGSAIFNVTPDSAGAYFNKIQCFCFTEQTLQPGESMDFPVVFFVDPAMADDPDLAHVNTITLSYTFYPVDKPDTLSEAASPGKPITN